MSVLCSSPTTTSSPQTRVQTVTSTSSGEGRAVCDVNRGIGSESGNDFWGVDTCVLQSAAHRHLTSGALLHHSPAAARRGRFVTTHDVIIESWLSLGVTLGHWAPV